MSGRVKQVGPGISVMTLTSRVFGRAKLVSCVVPVEPLIQRLVHHVYSPPWQPTFVAKFILYSLAIEVLLAQPPVMGLYKSVRESL